jgi:hypothetical protein
MSFEERLPLRQVEAAAARGSCSDEQEPLVLGRELVERTLHVLPRKKDVMVRSVVFGRGGDGVTIVHGHRPRE